mgnify:CR=1 FL=1
MYALDNDSRRANCAAAELRDLRVRLLNLEQVYPDTIPAKIKQVDHLIKQLDTKPTPHNAYTAFRFVAETWDLLRRL